MGTILDIPQRYLDQRDWKYKVDRAQQCIITGVTTKNSEQIGIIIRLSEAGKYLQFHTLKLLTVQEHVYKGVLFQCLCTIAYQVKMLRLEYDPTDGGIRASIEMPLEDAVLTKGQFDRCLDGLVQLVSEIALPRIRAVLATGEDPGKQAIAAQLLQGMSPDILDALKDLIDQRRQGEA